MNIIRKRVLFLNLISIICMIYVGFGCATSKNKRNNENVLDNSLEKYRKVAGIDLEGDYNESKSYLLLKPLINKNQGINVDKVNTFFVIRVLDNALILEEEIHNGAMNWISDSEISIFYPSGVPGKEKTLIYNVITQSKHLKDL